MNWLRQQIAEEAALTQAAQRPHALPLGLHVSHFEHDHLGQWRVTTGQEHSGTDTTVHQITQIPHSKASYRRNVSTRKASRDFPHRQGSRQ